MELKEHPDRLTIDEYMAESSHCLFRQELDTPCHLHWHEFYELTYVRSGNGVNRVNGTDIPLQGIDDFGGNPDASIQRAHAVAHADEA
ncbi:hypothetical protein [Paenibacillus humicus]|uniref:hypothetical protein n=1 Tax=Paenibacillus humicus TaxID=412861 RepID=UPI003F138852